MRVIGRLMGFTVCAAMFGCATPNSVTYSAVNSPPRAFVRRAPADVDVFVGKPPTRPYVDVGLFEVYGGSGDDGARLSTENMLGTLRLHAGLRGCDAVQIMGVELWGRYGWRVVRGVCEMYTDEQAQQRAANPITTAAPPEPLPGEGKPCVQMGAPTSVDAICPDPLVCENKLCVSPYR